MIKSRHYTRINAAVWALLMVATAVLMSTLAPDVGRMVKNLFIVAEMIGWLTVHLWLKKRSNP